MRSGERRNLIGQSVCFANFCKDFPTYHAGSRTLLHLAGNKTYLQPQNSYEYMAWQISKNIKVCIQFLGHLVYK